MAAGRERGVKPQKRLLRSSPHRLDPRSSSLLLPWPLLVVVLSYCNRVRRNIRPYFVEQARRILRNFEP